MNNKVKTGLIGGGGLILGLVIGAAGGGGSSATPAASSTPVTSTVTVTSPATPAAETTVTQTVNVPVTQTVTAAAQPAADPASSGSGCDRVKEATLTGTPQQIKDAMNALIADKSADGTAREYAQYYLGRDAKDPQMQTADLSLIRLTCG